MAPGILAASSVRYAIQSVCLPFVVGVCFDSGQTETEVYVVGS